jgi:hypothetical protein
MVCGSSVTLGRKGPAVLQRYLRELDSVGAHWLLVVAIALLFLVVQVALTMRVASRARRRERFVRRLYDADRGDAGRLDDDELEESFPWIAWVRSYFPSGGGTPTGNITRDDVLHELDARVSSDSSYLLLQRMGIMAPLLGVVLTVVGFYWLEVDETAEQSLTSILSAVTPLVSGVGAGAVLALINQALLHGVGRRLDRLRSAARDWFDTAVWRHANVAQSAARSDALAVIEKFVSTVGSAADRHAASFARIDESTATMRRAAAQFHDVVGSFHGEMKSVPQALHVLQDAMAASARALQELILVGARAVSNLDVSVAAFRTTVDREFADAAKLHQRSGKSLASAVQQIGDSTELLHAASEGMARSLQSLTGAAAEVEIAGSRLQRTVEKDLAPTQHTMHDAASSFGQSAARLTEFIEDGLSPATQQLATLHETLLGMQEAVRSINRFSQSREDIDRLTATLAQAAEIAEAIQTLPQQLRTVLEQSAVQMADSAGSRGRKTWLGGRPR